MNIMTLDFDPVKEMSLKLFEAVGKDDAAAVRDLAKKGADLNPLDFRGVTPVIAAIKAGSYSAMSALIQAGADLEAKTEFGMTALIWAADNDNKKAVSTLIKAGADLNSADRHGWTALHHAAWNGDIPMMRELIRTGADIWLLNSSECTPLEILQYQYPKKSIKNIEKLKDLFDKTQSKRLSEEDVSVKTETGYEFDI